MDISSEETTENLTLFFNLQDFALQDVIQNSKVHFNPIGIVCDEGCTNHTALHKVYGPDIKNRAVTCIFHFEQCKNRYADSLAKCVNATRKQTERFHSSSTWPNSLSKPKHWQNMKKIHKKLKKFTQKKNHRKAVLEHWLDW